MILEIMNRYPRTYQHVRQMYCDLGGTPEMADFFMEGLCILRSPHFVHGVEFELQYPTDPQEHVHELHNLINDAFATRRIVL